MFARELADQASAFADEVERLHHIQIERETKRKAAAL